MSAQGFARNFLGKFPANHEVACILWARYFVDTENYDRTLPGYWRGDDAWMPFDIRESTRYARRRRDELNERARELRVAGDMGASNKAMERHSHRELVALLRDTEER